MTSTRSRSSILFFVAVGLVATLAGCGGSGEVAAPHPEDAVPRGATSTLPTPTVSGPVTGGLRGHAWMAADDVLSPLDALGYVQEEFFFSGTADRRTAEGDPLGTTAPYTTRMLVARPADPKDFNGTVLIEWLNVTAQFEIDVVWVNLYKELLRQGYAYVAMSVQQVGVNASPLGLKFWDPIRYLPLFHPGDAYAFDILGQGARALLSNEGIRPLGDLRPQRLIASGESQSAFKLFPYVNRVDQDHRVFDGYLIHTGPGAVRDGIPVPVLLFLSESELEGFTSSSGPRSAVALPEELAFVATLPNAALLFRSGLGDAGPDTDDFRVWEIAGASHFDRQALIYITAQATRDLVGVPVYDGVPLGCEKALASVPAFPYITIPPLGALGFQRIGQLGIERPSRAALRALNQWIITGDAPRSQPRIERNDDGSLARDEDGLSIGGVRMPVMEVPLGVNEGASCIFFGRYAEFPDVASRYASQDDYLQKLGVAAQKAVAQGVLLPPEADAYIEEAEDESAGIWD